MAAPAKRKIVKKPKLKSIPQIHRRLFKLASEKCRGNAEFKCEVCGKSKENIHDVSGKPIRLDAHHVMSRDVKDSPMKWDLRNLVCLCNDHHKFNHHSAHKHGLWFAKTFESIRPNDVEFILTHDYIQKDLKNRDNLEYIEQCLKNNIEIDYCKLK